MMADRRDGEDASPLDATIVRRAIRLNTVVLALAFGLCCGTALLLVTLLSLAVTGEHAGRYLDLLGIFMPGYRASIVGAWIGFFWAFLYAALSGAVFYRVYMHAAGIEIPAAARSPSRDFVTARLSGLALGVALGTLLGAQLFLSSAWLIIRGTAAESRNAALLASYLPGYSVTWSGAVTGASWLFIYTLIFSVIFAAIYNTVAQMRAKRAYSNGDTT